MQANILAGETADARAHVSGDNRLGAEARLGIYAQGYRQRLLECLRTEYPVLARVAGPTAFELFAHAYVDAYPSHSYTLYDFGAGFADWLEASRPPGPAHAAEAIPAALARIERARAEVARARGVEQLAAPSGGLDPLILGMLGLRRHWRPDSVRLLSLAFDFSETLAAAAREETPPLPRPEPSYVAVTRVHYRVECHALEAWQYGWLAALSETPELAVVGAGDDVRLAGWLPAAVAQGLVAAA